MTASAIPTVPGHIGLAVRDLRRSIDFYAAAFALALVSGAPTCGAF